ncbi:RagB/SusD family nutrient uptake outer membrane protein [Muricauda sp. MAR_2010_75]|jgi:tetratricopeptide (TPR) repeat protein|uniref:RagB/SusD family nutrient uptake outer membrane protein n=1 Tax=Allomuricauda sp. MAR_2010_75 TaxID=1250232 RepID=UPI000563DE1E|nr:RagB/SusD family nutrient uptake outer membrane protein [Muricauda sp. MAR_2010_75]
MKKTIVKTLCVFLILLSCSENFTDIAPKGSLNSDALANEQGVDLLLIGAYSMLDGFRFGLTQDYRSSGDNWWFDVVSDDAHKGATNGDQNELYLLEHFDWATNNPYIRDEWVGPFAGVNRANAVLAQAAAIEGVDLTQQIAEARFLRGHFNFELQRTFRNIPFLSEEDLNDPNKPNPGPIWDKIEEDFQAAIDDLPEVSGEVGRANSWAAKAYLGKVYLYQEKFTEALAVFQDVINNGPYGLHTEYVDNFNLRGENGVEAVFSIQFFNDSGDSFNGNRGGALNHPGGGPLNTCCGFYQPSQDLVNSFQTDPSGLPLLDTWNQTDVTNDQGIASDEPFTVHSGPLDPRLDYTVGRRDIDFNGFGRNPGFDWVRVQSAGGPYLAAKNTYRASEPEARSTGGPWGQDRSGINYNIIRFADVLLMAAEAAVETGDLDTALDYVNQVRTRAKNMTYVPTVEGVNPTNYQVEPYVSFPDQAFARKAVRFERRLELGMEGHRYFDLARWGVLESTMNTYFPNEERTIPGIDLGIPVLPKHSVFPIPIEAIDLSNGVLEQNPEWQ